MKPSKPCGWRSTRRAAQPALRRPAAARRTRPSLVIRPDVLLLDEPLSNLDAKLRIELRSEIRRICKDAGMTAIYVTHDQKEALSMADRVAIVNQGRVVQIGPPGELYRRPHTPFVASFLGETNFVEGTIIERTEKGVGVQTPIGRIHAATISPKVGEASKVLCSIRPEAIRIGAPRRSQHALRPRGPVHIPRRDRHARG